MLNLKYINNVVIIPNPVSESATISFSIFQSENIKITVNDITGRLIKNLFDGLLNTGVHQISWNPNDDEVEG